MFEEAHREAVRPPRVGGTEGAVGGSPHDEEKDREGWKGQKFQFGGVGF